MEPFREDNGHFLYPKTGAERTVRQFNLEAIARRLDRVEIDGLKHAPVEALEPTGKVTDG